MTVMTVNSVSSAYKLACVTIDGDTNSSHSGVSIEGRDCSGLARATTGWDYSILA